MQKAMIKASFFIVLPPYMVDLDVIIVSAYYRLVKYLFSRVKTHHTEITT